MLADAGVKRVIFTPTNDATKDRWAWQPRRTQLVRGLLAAKELGLEVWLGPWVRCSKPFLDDVGRNLRILADEVGGVDGWELDAEGSWEVTARSAGRRHPGGIKGAVEENIHHLTQHMTERELLSATALYFNRPGCDALLRCPQESYLRRYKPTQCGLTVTQPKRRQPTSQTSSPGNCNEEHGRIMRSSKRTAP